MTQPADGSTLAQPLLPTFEVQIGRPDLSPWLAGNIGLPGFSSFDGPEPGPHVAVMALTHGNEISGAVVLDALLRQNIRPLRGRLTLGFANLAAFARFDPAQPTASRFVDEDFNRLWDRAVLDGPRQTTELARARQVRPLIDTVDILLDLHSMLWDADPLMLCGSTEKGRRLAAQITLPDLVVADEGHVSGRRLIDYDPFLDPGTVAVANLVESGQHWMADAVTMSDSVTRSLLQANGMIAQTVPVPANPRRKIAEVTHAITAATASFVFMQSYRGGDVIARRNTLIAMDGNVEIRTPYDHCLLVMPSLRPSRGHTAVRLARFVK